MKNSRISESSESEISYSNSYGEEEEENSIDAESKNQSNDKSNDMSRDEILKLISKNVDTLSKDDLNKLLKIIRHKQ